MSQDSVVHPKKRRILESPVDRASPLVVPSDDGLEDAEDASESEASGVELVPVPHHVCCEKACHIRLPAYYPMRFCLAHLHMHLSRSLYMDVAMDAQTYKDFWRNVRVDYDQPEEEASDDHAA